MKRLFLLICVATFFIATTKINAQIIESGSFDQGINAAQICRDDNRISSGINFDGLAGSDLIKDGTNKAFMILKSDLKMPENILIHENSFLKNSSSDIYRITISGAVHTNFSDMPLFSSKMKGKIDTELCFDIINNISLDFLNKYILEAKGINIKKLLVRILK